MVRLLAGNWTQSSSGYNERIRHIESIRSGAEAFGVIAFADPRKSGGVRIQSYDAQHLIKFGSLIQPDAQNLYARISRIFPVAKISAQNRSIGDEAADVAELNNRLDLQHRPTYRRALIDARLGQGKFRRELLNKWGNACAVTGSAIQEALRASHMRPWADSNDRQRLEPDNGLPLVGTLDALFDRGLITFEDDGQMLVSRLISKKEKNLLGLQGGLRQALNEQQLNFLAFHRNNVFRGPCVA